MRDEQERGIRCQLADLRPQLCRFRVGGQAGAGQDRLVKVQDLRGDARRLLSPQVGAGYDPSRGEGFFGLSDDVSDALDAFGCQGAVLVPS